MVQVDLDKLFNLCLTSQLKGTKERQKKTRDTERMEAGVR